MIILDTNIVSELLRPEPNRTVTVWFERQDPATLHTTSVTLAEILFGLELMPDGSRRAGLTFGIGRIFATRFADRVLAFDQAAAVTYASIRAGRRKSGRPMTEFDGQIAAIARSRNAVLATRNTRDFTGCGIELVDPWQYR